jgi:hypothetical protein
LDAAKIQSNADPFHFGDQYNSGNDLVPFSFGLWLESSFYNELTQSTTVTFYFWKLLISIVSVLSNATVQLGIRPKCVGDLFRSWRRLSISRLSPTSSNITYNNRKLIFKVANLVGGLNGTGNVLLGAVVDGPSETDNFSGLGVPDGAKKCNMDKFSAFNGKGVKYIDNVTSWPSSEPANDYVVMSLLAFARTAKVGF